MNRPTFNAMLAQYAVREVSGIGAVSWENGAHCELPSVIVRGAATQAKYAGKNLFDISKMNPTTESSQTETRISEVGADYIIVKTPAGTDTPGPANSKVKLSVLAPALEVEKAYRLSLTSESGRNYIYLYPSKETWRTSSPLTITEASLDSTLRFYGQTKRDSEKDLFAKISNIQIEEGTVATTYEPYTGGKPAPSIDYPVLPQFSTGVVLEGADGGTVALPDLLALPDTEVADEAEYIGGEGWRITRRVGHIEGYAGEAVGEAWCSSTGELSDGALVWYALAEPTDEILSLGRLIQPKGSGSVVQTSGELQVPISVKYVTHS